MNLPTAQIDKSTQTDLLYGLAAGSTVDAALLSPPPDTTPAGDELSVLLPVDNEELDDPVILKNAATRGDGSLGAQIGAIDGIAAARKERRWRYLDGIAPPAEIEAPPIVVATPPAVEDSEAREEEEGDEAARSSWIAYLWRVWKASFSWLVSFTTHVVLLPVLVLFHAPEPMSLWRPVVQVTHGERPRLEQIDVPVTMAISSQEYHAVQPVTLAVSIDPHLTPGAAEGEWSDDPNLTARLRERGPVGDVREFLGRAGEGHSTAKEEKEKRGAEFFGAKAAGNKFVFVVDCSVSMQGNRWLHACQELDAAIGRLRAEQLFFVILFDGGVHRMFNLYENDAALFPATAENKARFRLWLSTVRLGYETRPYLAVRVALQLRPDAIYLLSDGDFRDPTAEFLKDVNRPRDHRGNTQRQVAVHTVSFHSRVGQAIMRRISRENGGQHVFVGAR